MTLFLRSYLTSSRALAFVTSLAIIYRFVAQPPRRVHSIRKVILGLTSTVFFVVIFTVVLTAIAIKYSSPGEVDGEPTTMEPYPFSPQFHNYFHTFLTALIAAAPGSLVSLFSHVWKRWTHWQFNFRSLYVTDLITLNIKREVTKINLY